MWFIVNLACLSCFHLYFTQFESSWALYRLLSLSLSLSFCLCLCFPAFMCGFAECFNFLLSGRFERPLGHSRTPQHTHSYTHKHTHTHVDVRSATPTRPPTTQHSNGQRATSRPKCKVKQVGMRCTWDYWAAECAANVQQQQIGMPCECCMHHRQHLQLLLFLLLLGTGQVTVKLLQNFFSDVCLAVLITEVSN